MSITFNTPLGMWHMANYSFVISHAAGLEETSEKPAKPQQCNRKRGEECKPCESKMRIQNSIEKWENFPVNLTGHLRVLFGLTLRGMRERSGRAVKKRKTGEGRKLLLSKCWDTSTILNLTIGKDCVSVAKLLHQLEELRLGYLHGCSLTCE